MSNSIFSILSINGFTEETDKIMYWGMGSLMWGDAITVVAKDNDMFSVTVEHWFYDDNGDPAPDNMRETRVLHGAQALAWVFTEAPKSFWRRR